jgi:hypothetical protein
MQLQTCESEKQLDIAYHYHQLPNAKSDASASMIKGLDWFACTKIGADVNAFFKLSKDLAALALHVNDLFFLVSSMRGITIFE